MSKIDVTFKIRAKQSAIDAAYLVVEFYPCRGTLVMLPETWQAFKSLLIPSTMADFVITEVDADGKPL